MNDIHEKAIEISVALMSANLRSNAYGTNINQASEMAKFFLELESEIANGLERIPVDTHSMG